MKTLIFPSLVAVVAFLTPTQAAEPAKFQLASPKPHQVVQRVGFDARSAAKEQPGHAAFGFADIAIAGDLPQGAEKANWQYRVVKLEGATGRDTPWSPLDVRLHGRMFTSRARVPAGGWYRLEIRGRENENVIATATVEPIAVGEVFIVAGQSYATNCNDERFKVADTTGRVVAFDYAKETWAVANDPQPAPDNSDGGSIWPPLGDALLKEFRVPIGFANVAVGATSSVQWLPNGTLHPRLVKAGKSLGAFRAILWQQGESDVIAKTTKAKYVENVKNIRTVAAKEWNSEPTWILAKSTHHPTVYNDADGEGRIRSAIDELTKQQGFVAGPDTDKLTGENRGDAKSRRHFSSVGQKRAAEMWFDVLKTHLNSPPPVHELLPDLKLLEPAWLSPVVHRESSVLLQAKVDAPGIARLAFPAAEIIEVSTADRLHRFRLGQDFTLSKDGLQLIFSKPEPVALIAAADLFLPKGSPNSYQHRVGQPEVNLLYRPGHWFHDRNIEVTYRRGDSPSPAARRAGTLPKTMTRLRAGEKIVLGISGDSISTGLDSSASAKAYPFQPGYAELVAAQLRASFPGEVSLHNRSVSGWSVASGVADAEKLLAEKPNLVVVAYGMNDVGRRDPKWFAEQTRKLIDKIRTASAETEIILVSPMLGNAEWIHTPRDMFAKYRDELKSLCGEGIALADVSEVWQLLLKNKHDHDLTGNGLNHPNDFGHRLYAQAVLSVLREPK